MSERAFTAGTKTNNSNTSQISVDNLLTISRTMHASFINTFRGIKVVVDENLKGYEWHCSVSPKLFNKIKKEAENGN